MLIELTDDFVNRLRTLSDDQEKNKAIFLIDSALSQVSLHNHIVFASLQAIKNLKNEERVSYLSKLILQWMEKNIQNLNSIRQIVNFIVRPTFGNTLCFTELETKISYYLININDLDEFKKSVLITENASDYDFYLGVYDWINNSKFYSSHLKNISSNGANADKTIITNDRDKEFICCVFDSDKNYNDDANGATLKNAINGYKFRKNLFLPFNLYALPVREKENLFPYKEYLKESNIEAKTKALIKLLVDETNNEVLGFFDLKDGIKYKKINKHNHNEKWRTLYFPFIKKCIDNGICETQCCCFVCSNDTCAGCEKEDKKYIAGIGDKLLSESSKKFFNDNSLKFNDSTNIDSIFGNQKFILDIWKQIAKLLFSFGSSISGSINFIV